MSRLARIKRKVWRRLTRHDQKVARLEPGGGAAAAPKGSVLLSYILDPLLARRSADHSHTHFWETLTIANAFVDAGYAVDGISWTNHRFQPDRTYDVLIDVRLNMERLAPKMQSALKIFHSDTCHWRFNNEAQEARHRSLQVRRGVTLQAHKLLPTNQGVEQCDVLTYLGNQFTADTFAFAEKPALRIPVSVPFTYGWPEDKDWHACRRNFLWFGSGGLVHKGLDLVLEAFAGLPEHHLTVCGPIEAEADFAREYQRELRELPNITLKGWVDTASTEFTGLCRNTVGLVYPSCAEGGGSSALTCMHAGLIPILTSSASVDVTPDTGVLLEDCSVEGLREAIVATSDRPARDLEAMARGAWEWVRQHHSKEVFDQRYRDFVRRVDAGDLERK